MKIEDIKEITVIGSGDMGHGIAEVCIINGFQVKINDIELELLEKAKKRIKNSLNKLVSKNKLSNEKVENSIKRLKLELGLKEAVKDSQLVIEAIPEILSLKKEIFAKIDSYLPKEGIIASNTSNMSITELAKNTERPDKVIGLHFFNPVILKRTVEVIRGEKTSDETFHMMKEFVKSIKKLPIGVKKDTPGFIVNRVMAPVNILIGKILEKNLEEPGRVDMALKSRGMAMGAFELADYVGLDVMYHSMKYFEKTLSPEYKPPNWLKQKIEKNELGKKTGNGIYNWSKGRPDLSKYEPSNKIEIQDLIALQVNEATKLLDEGVIDKPRMIDKAIINGTGNPAGVIKLAKGLGLDEMVKRCEKLSSKYNINVFEPTKRLKNGNI
ncbi:MAG: 3-hydroxyacyl-CoA dehydrogenase family protein [Candidatus Lokiarchaeota archaeon]|nr:3-hydroxyacyl-CoA dehydrogenase family protein [Candidatus Lokiarchaeota archaeon]